MSEPKQANETQGETRGEGLVEGRAEGLIEGRAEGLLEGRAKGMADALIVVLEARFGSIPGVLYPLIQGTNDQAVLRQWLVEATNAVTPEDFLQTISGSSA